MKQPILALVCSLAAAVFGVMWLGQMLPSVAAREVALSGEGTAVVLYDGTLGGTPTTQGFFYQNLPTGTAGQIYTNGVTILDSTLVGDNAYAGYTGNPALVPTLDRVAGYRLHFTVQIESEAHSNNNRAGFSVIVLSDDTKGIELGFWTDEVWAQSDDSGGGPLFTHAEGTIFTTTTGLINYELTILSDTYSLYNEGNLILTGPLRDYRNFTGPIDPYETPNFIFLGDDTFSAQARIRLAYVAVTTELPPPEPDYYLYLPLVLTS